MAFATTGRARLAPRTTTLYETGMPIRLKKLIGTALLIILVIVYAILATLFAVAQLSESGPLVHLAFFLFSGLLWILPAMAIIKYMMVERR